MLVVFGALGGRASLVGSALGDRASLVAKWWKDNGQVNNYRSVKMPS